MEKPWQCCCRTSTMFRVSFNFSSRKQPLVWFRYLWLVKDVTQLKKKPFTCCFPPVPSKEMLCLSARYFCLIQKPDRDLHLILHLHPVVSLCPSAVTSEGPDCTSLHCCLWPNPSNVHLPHQHGRQAIWTSLYSLKSLQHLQVVSGGFESSSVQIYFFFCLFGLLPKISFPSQEQFFFLVFIK